MVPMSMAWPWHAPPRPQPSGAGPLLHWLAALLPRRPSPTDGVEGVDGVAGQPPATRAQEETASAAFEAFFLRYARPVTGYLWRVTGDEQLASELAQETFLRAWEHFDTIAHYEQPLSWLFRVATNLARQQHRRRLHPAAQTVSLDLGGDPAASDPARRFIEQDLVRHTLLQLSFEQRTALVLCEVYGLSCAEAGALLHISRDAVKMALWRAREQFRVRYLREDEDAR